MTCRHVDRDGPVWTIRLDRPHVRNSSIPATAAEDLLAGARVTAAGIAGNAPLTVAAIERTYTAEHRRAFAAERAAALTVLATDDAREGAQAFLQRRPPHFLGR